MKEVINLDRKVRLVSERKIEELRKNYGLKEKKEIPAVKFEELMKRSEKNYGLYKKKEIQAVKFEELMKRSEKNYGLKETKRNPSRKVRQGKGRKT